MDACDPGMNIDDLRQLIKSNIGKDINLTRKQICDAYTNIQDKDLPLPPLVLTRDRRVMVDGKSPLKARDFETLFKTASKLADIKKLAKKMGVIGLQEMTKGDLVSAIKDRLRSSKIREPIILARRRITSKPFVNDSNFITNTNNRTNENFTANANKNFGNNANVDVNASVNANANRNVSVNANNRPRQSINETTSVSMPSKLSFGPTKDIVTRSRPINTTRRPYYPNVNGGGSGWFSKGEVKPTTRVSIPSKMNIKKPVGMNTTQKKNTPPPVPKNNVPKNNVPPVPPAPPVPPRPVGPPSASNLQTAKKKMEIKAYLKNKNATNAEKVEILNSINTTTNVENLKRKINNRFRVKSVELKNYLQSVNELSNADKELLLLNNSIKNINEMRSAVNALITKRKSEKSDASKQELIEFLNGLVINKADKNRILAKFNNENVSVNILKKEAQNIQTALNSNKKIATKNGLMTFLNSTSLNQVDKNALLQKLNNGVDIVSIQEEAKKLNTSRKIERTEKKKEELRRFLGDIQLNNIEKTRYINSVNNATNLNTLKNEIRKLSNVSVNQKKKLNRQDLNGYVNALGLTPEEKKDIMNKFNSNASNVDALKREANAIRNDKKSKKRLQLTNMLNKTNLNQTTKNTLLSKFNSDTANVENLRLEINKLVQLKANTNKSQRRQELENYMRNTDLSNVNKNQFITELNTGNTNLNTIKRKINNLLEQRISNKKNANRSELIAYLNTLTLPEPNKNEIIAKFGNGLSISNAKNAAKTLETQRKGEKFTANRETLSEYIRGLRVNGQQVLSDFDTGALSLNNAKKRVDVLANSRRVDKLNANRKILENQMKNLELTNEERQILVGNLTDEKKTLNMLLVNAKNLHNATVQRRKNENRARIKNTINKMNLTNVNKQDLMRRYNNGNTNIEQAAKNLMKQRNDEKFKNLTNKMRTYLNTLELSNENKQTLLAKVTSINANTNAIRNEAKQLEQKRKINLRNTERNTLVKYLKNKGLAQNDTNSILNRFDKSNVGLNTLRKNANELAETRKSERLVLNKDTLIEHMKKLGLPNSNQTLLLTKLNSPYINIEQIINEATDLSLKRAEEKRVANRTELNKYVQSLNLMNDDKKYILKSFDDETANVEFLKNKARELVDTRAQEKITALTNKFKQYVNTVPLNQNNKNTLMRNFSANVNKNVNVWTKKANTLLNTRKSESKAANRKQLNNFMSTLNIPNTNKIAILENFDKNIGTLNSLRNRAQNAANTVVKAKIAKRREEFIGFVNNLGLRGQDRNGLLAKFNATPNNMNTLKNEAAQLANSIKRAKKNANMANLNAYISRSGVNNTDRNKLISNFSQSNISLENMKLKVNQTIKNRIAEKRVEFSKFLGTLELSNANKNTVLKKFDEDSSNIGKLQENATSLVNQRIREKRTANRNALSNYVKTLNLKNEDKNAILAEFNNSSAELMVMRTKANDLVTQRKGERINAAKSELNSYLNSLGLVGEDKNSVMRKFNANSGNISTLRNEATKLANRRKLEATRAKRKELTNLLNTLNVSNKDKEELLKKFNAEANSLNAIKQEAMNLNKLAKNKAVAIANLRQHLNALSLNGSVKNSLISKLNNGSATLNAVKAEATNIDMKYRAEITNKKKDELRKFMENKNLMNTNRNSFINRVTNESTNIEPIKREIIELNKVIKQKKQNEANKIAKFNAYLNSLNLNEDEKAEFKNKLSSENANVNAIKAQAMAKSNEKRLEKHLMGLKHLSGKDMAMFANKLKSNLGAYNTIMKQSSDLNAKIKSEKDALKKSLENTNLNKSQKIAYIKQLNQNHTNVEPIKAIVEKNIANKKEKKIQLIKNTASKLQSMTNLERNNRKEFMNRLNKGNNVNKILKNANIRAKERKSEANIRKVQNRIPNNVDPTKKKYIVDEYLRGASENAITSMINDAALDKFRAPLKQKIVDKIPGRFGVFRRGWESLVTSAKTKEDLDSIEKLLDEKTSLREQIEASNITDNEKQGHIKWVMQHKNDITKRRKEFEGHLNARRRAKNQLKKNTASTLQSLTTLEKVNRTAFMNRLNKGEDPKKIVANATKMNSNRKVAKLEAETKERARQKQIKLLKNTAKYLQNLKGLERSNRKEFMNRLNRGEDPAKVFNNAQKKNKATREFSFDKKPKNQLKPTRFGTNANNAKRQIRSFKRMGLKSQNKYITRINAGENAVKVLNEAKRANSKIPISKGKRNLQGGMK